MWIIFLLKYICDKMRRESTFGILFHSKHLKMFSDPEGSCIRTPRHKWSMAFLLNSADFHSVLALPYLPWDKENETCPVVTTCLGKQSSFPRQCSVIKISGK